MQTRLLYKKGIKEPQEKILSSGYSHPQQLSCISSFSAGTAASIGAKALSLARPPDVDGVGFRFGDAHEWMAMGRLGLETSLAVIVIVADFA